MRSIRLLVAAAAVAAGLAAVPAIAAAASDNMPYNLPATGEDYTPPYSSDGMPYNGVTPDHTPYN